MVFAFAWFVKQLHVSFGRVRCLFLVIAKSASKIPTVIQFIIIITLFQKGGTTDTCTCVENCFKNESIKWSKTVKANWSKKQNKIKMVEKLLIGLK